MQSLFKKLNTQKIQSISIEEKFYNAKKYLSDKYHKYVPKDERIDKKTRIYMYKYISGILECGSIKKKSIKQANSREVRKKTAETVFLAELYPEACFTMQQIDQNIKHYNSKILSFSDKYIKIVAELEKNKMIKKDKERLRMGDETNAQLEIIIAKNKDEESLLFSDEEDGNALYPDKLMEQNPALSNASRNLNFSKPLSDEEESLFSDDEDKDGDGNVNAKFLKDNKMVTGKTHDNKWTL